MTLTSSSRFGVGTSSRRSPALVDRYHPSMVRIARAYAATKEATEDVLQDAWLGVIWYAAWDLAFHCVPLAAVDPQFAKTNYCCCAATGTCTRTGSSPRTSGRSAT
jgi:Sigma-70 region 2